MLAGAYEESLVINRETKMQVMQKHFGVETRGNTYQAMCPAVAVEYTFPDVAVALNSKPEKKQEEDHIICEEKNVLDCFSGMLVKRCLSYGNITIRLVCDLIEVVQKTVRHFQCVWWLENLKAEM